MNEALFETFQRFFPGEGYSEAEVTAAVGDGQLTIDPERILPYLLTSLVDEKVLEVEMDGVPKVYFSRLKDHPQNLDEIVELDSENEEQQELLELDRIAKQGEYLQRFSHLIILPLEPGMGNLFLRQSSTVVLRMFTQSMAVEMGTSFIELLKIDDLPVVKLQYPEILRKLRNRREYRAKVIDSLDFVGSIELDEDQEPMNLPVADISVSGIALQTTRKEQRLFKQGQRLILKLYLNDELRVSVECTIRHLARLRKRLRVEYLIGLEFEPGSKYTMAAIESIVAEVQRAHLKELAAKADAGGFDAIT